MEATKKTQQSNEPIEKLDIFTVGLYCSKGRFDIVGTELINNRKPFIQTTTIERDR